MSSKPRILLLEDDDDLRELLEDVLEDEGFDVESAERGEFAVELAGQRNFDLIIADIRMEGMGGLAALEQTQNLQPGIGSLIVSGYATEIEAARAESLNVGALVKKPFDMNKFLQLVRQELGSRKKHDVEVEREQVFQQGLEWALSSLAQTIDDSGFATSSVQKAAALAEAVADSLECETDSLLAVRWATIFLAGERILEQDLPAILTTGHLGLPLVGQIISEIQDEAETGSREVQIVRLCLRYIFRESEEDGVSREGVNDDVFGAYSELAPKVEAKRKVDFERLSSQSETRSLLSLAMTLERLGDLENASRAYTQLCESSVLEREKIDAWLGRARLAAAQKNQSELLFSAKECFKITRARGPRSLASKGLEATLMLEQAGAEETEQALTVVGQAAQSVDFKVGLALVRCALSRIQEKPLKKEHVTPFLSHHAFQDLTPYINWFFRYLFSELKGDESCPLSQVLLKITPDFSSLFLYWLEPTRCPADTRLRVAKAISQANFLPKSIIEKLLEDPESEIRTLGNSLRSKCLGNDSGLLLRVQSFGVPKVFYQGEPLDESEWKTRKVKYLFFYLASRWGEPVTEDHLIESFWPKASSRSQQNLYWATSRLRAVLKKMTEAPFDPVVRSDNSLSLNPKLLRWHDLEIFRDSFQRAQDSVTKENLEAAREHLAQAASVYSGPYLDGCYYDFAVTIKRQTEEQSFEANSKVCQMYLDQNQDSLALEYATNAMELDPLDEDVCVCKMRALIRLRKADIALEVYEKYMKLLAEDGIDEPPLRLFELFHRARMGYTDA